MRCPICQKPTERLYKGYCWSCKSKIASTAQSKDGSWYQESLKKSKWEYIKNWRPDPFL